MNLYNFSPDGFPVLLNPKVKALKADQWLLTQYLYAYLDFTINLEIVIINRACEILLSIQNELGLSEMEITAILGIYRDESEHAYKAFVLKKHIMQKTGNHQVIAYEPYLRKSLDSMKNQVSKKDEHFVDVFFTIISETLISDNLSLNSRSEFISDEIKSFFLYHEKSERYHSAFFKKLFPRVWSVLDARSKKSLESLFPKMFRLFLEPNIPYIKNLLAHLGANDESCKDIVDSVYTDEYLQNMIIKDTKETVELFSSHGVSTFIT